MTDALEKRLHDAFDNVHVPDELAARTLAGIEKARSASDEQAERVSPASFEVVDTPATVTKRRSSSARKPMRRVAITALAACLALVIFGIGGVAWAAQPYAFVTIDVNPSLELGINRFDRVASATAFNADGEQILSEANVEGMSYEDALAALGSELQPYLSEGTAVEITISCDDAAHAARYEQVGRHCLDSSGAEQVHCSHAGTDEHHAANEAGLGVNRYRLYQELLAQDVDISLEEAQAMSASELRALLADNAEYDETRGENGNGHHNEGDHKRTRRRAHHE